MAFLIFIFGYLPVSGLIPFYYQYLSTVADRYIYISMAGIALLAAYIYTQILNSTMKNIIFNIILILLFSQTIQQIPTWVNEFSIWDNAIAKTPVPTAPIYLGRGEQYLSMDKVTEAIADFTKSIDLDPKEPRGFYNRGNAYLDIRNYDAAIKDFTKAISLNPDFSFAYCNRGHAYFYKEWGHLK